MSGLKLKGLSEDYSIVRLEPDAPIPAWAQGKSYLSVTRTPEELSILCETKGVPDGVTCEGPWSGFRVEGTLDLSLIGITSQLSKPLADAKINILAMATYDTDYLFVPTEKRDRAIEVLQTAGYTVAGG